MLTADDIGGVHVKYLSDCPRQLWLYGRGVRPESRSDRVQLGEAVHDTSYRREHPVDLGAAKLDHFDGQRWVHEVKSSNHPTEADHAQAMHYCYRLRHLGIDVEGAILKYPKIRRTVRISYTEAEGAAAAAMIASALDTLTADTSPPRLRRRDCYGCSYLDYCWTD
ncbi:CRISPR-associated protein Cas4 [Nocardia lijiangensis]|uniref:CRISPR-associated protein Cas4 n=1 Tax=Nocardia lijiangensis TaxID=299618 RepID=UPI00082E407F|nr:CRISPR-associated protein Cas4 [Nocardia lijiangensis]